MTIAESARSQDQFQPVRLKWVSQINPGTPAPSAKPDQEIPFVPMESIAEGGGIDLSERKPLSEVGSGYTRFRSGDVLVAKITPCFENGKGALVPELSAPLGAATTEVHVLRPGPQIDRRFLFYWSMSDAFRVPAAHQMQGAGGQKRVQTSYLAGAELKIPPLTDQRTIADFLDRETTHIDTLVEQKERLIELLDEKRSALITHAVTKGLDPDVPMKDSGVEWIGDIPEHWEVARLKFLLSHFVDCLHSTPTYSDEGRYPAVRTADVQLGRLDISGARMVERSEFEHRVGRLIPDEGDILYSREGERFGHAALVPPEVELCLSQRMVHLRARRKVNPGFLMWALNSRGSYQQAALDTLGATTPHVNLQTIRNFVVAVPPLPEQEVIRRTLEGRLDAFTEAGKMANESITLLRERRSALITAAVTGQIDINEYANE